MSTSTSTLGGRAFRGRAYPTPRTPVQLGWRRRARCVGADPCQFDELDGRGLTEIPLHIRFAAFTHCLGCPVQRACGAEADAAKYVGVWAGKYRRFTRAGYEVTDLLRRTKGDLGGVA